MTAPLLSAPGAFTTADSPDARQAETLRPGQALVRVVAGGICGSDAPLFRGGPLPPSAGTGLTNAGPPVGYPMHEIVGDLVAVADGTADPLPTGTRVVGWATSYNGMADYVVTDCASLAPCPDRWQPADAVVIQPLACVLQAVGRLGDVSGRHCAVIGLGPIGLMFCHVMKDRGAARVTGVDRVDRTPLASRFGIDAFRWSGSERWAAELNEGDRPDVVVEAVGHQVVTLQHALSAVAPNGRVFYFGINDHAMYPLDMELMLRKHLTLMSGYTKDRRRALTAATAYLDRYPELIGHLVTHRFDRADAQRAYDTAATQAPGRLKVVMNIAPRLSRAPESQAAGKVRT